VNSALLIWRHEYFGGIALYTAGFTKVSIDREKIIIFNNIKTMNGIINGFNLEFFILEI